MSAGHIVEVFSEGGEWGWQCHTPGCREEATGYEDFDSADVAADEHRREHRGTTEDGAR